MSAKQPQRRRKSDPLRPPRPISIRMTTVQLQRLDAALRRSVAADEQPNRSRVVAAMATKQAEKVLAGEPPLNLCHSLDFIQSATLTVSISFSPGQELLVQQACAATNQRFGPFVLWSVMAYLDQLGEE